MLRFEILKGFREAEPFLSRPQDTRRARSPASTALRAWQGTNGCGEN